MCFFNSDVGQVGLGFFLVIHVSLACLVVDAWSYSFEFQGVWLASGHLMFFDIGNLGYCSFIAYNLWLSGVWLQIGPINVQGLFDGFEGEGHKLATGGVCIVFVAIFRVASWSMKCYPWRSSDSAFSVFVYLSLSLSSSLCVENSSQSHTEDTYRQRVCRTQTHGLKPGHRREGTQVRRQRKAMYHIPVKV